MSCSLAYSRDLKGATTVVGCIKILKVFSLAFYVKVMIFWDRLKLLS
jgi:hypothetical protein